ncbi:hypothetical protein NG796_16960 [Laspinema sp. A4]|nr:hypothetical protein [Laspinema sp. D2d]
MLIRFQQLTIGSTFRYGGGRWLKSSTNQAQLIGQWSSQLGQPIAFAPTDLTIYR